METIRIGITDCAKFTNYESWFVKEPGVEVIKLSHEAGNVYEAKSCHGVVLSGGEDVHPRFYGQAEYVKYCDTIDERRDDFEWRVLEQTEYEGIPLLGICRGLQMANVFFGGTLMPDLPSFGKYNHSRFSDRDRYHPITVDPTSQLSTILGSSAGEINSAHHQSAALVGKGLVANALSPDGVIEGLERRDHGKPYFLLVQWHPERMTKPENPFAANIKSSFLAAARERKEA